MTNNTPCVYEITVDEGEAVVIVQHHGYLHRAGEAKPLTGRHDSAGSLRVSSTLAEGAQRSRAVLQGFVTTSAADALLWASELAHERAQQALPIECSHAVIVEALTPRCDLTTGAK